MLPSYVQHQQILQCWNLERLITQNPDPHYYNIFKSFDAMSLYLVYMH